MKPGRELDALIAEKIFGLKRTDESIWSKDDEEVYWPDSTHSQEDVYLPHYSTDIAAAWQVINNFEKKKIWPIQLELIGELGWEVTLGEGIGNSHSIPHAICLAALETII